MPSAISSMRVPFDSVVMNGLLISQVVEALAQSLHGVENMLEHALDDPLRPSVGGSRNQPSAEARRTGGSIFRSTGQGDFAALRVEGNVRKRLHDLAFVKKLAIDPAYARQIRSENPDAGMF